MITRRAALKGTTLLFAVPALGAALPNAVSALAQPQPATGATSASLGLIDAHCHIFNATDIPVLGYLRKVIFDLYDSQIAIDVADPPARIEPRCEEDQSSSWIEWKRWRDWITWPGRAAAAEAAAALCYEIVQNKARTADQELDSLNDPATADTAAAPAATPSIAGDDLVSFFADTADAADTAGAPEPPEVSNWSLERRQAREEAVRAGREPLKQWLLDQAKRAGLPDAASAADSAGGDPFADKAQANAIADALNRSDDYVSRHVRWMYLLRSDRAAIADKLEALYARKGRFVLYAPAILDYSKWLEGEPLSDLESQAKIMARIAMRGGNVRFHGYMGYDPLRDVQQGGTSKALVKNAVENHGFLGAKLYPTMGFKPLNNASSKGLRFPRHALRKAAGPNQTVQLRSAVELARELDAKLAEFYEWAQAEEVPLLVHATNSYGAGPCYALRADPSNWKPVLDRFPRIRVCLGHFGDFEEALDGTAINASKLPNTWEYHFGEMTTRSDSFAYADVSYLAEILNEEPDSTHAKALKAALVALIKKYPNVPLRLIYGTDYLLLALERKPEDHYAKLQQFLKGVFDEVDSSKTQAWLAGVFRENAIRFLGLRTGRTRVRLQKFYNDNSVDDSFLKEFD